MTNSIIIYRNPMEKAMWETLMSSDVIVYLFIIGIGFTVGVLCHTIMMAYIPKSKRFQTRTIIDWTCAFICVGIWGTMLHQIGVL